MCKTAAWLYLAHWAAVGIERKNIILDSYKSELDVTACLWVDRLSLRPLVPVAQSMDWSKCVCSWISGLDLSQLNFSSVWWSLNWAQSHEEKVLENLVLALSCHSSNMCKKRLPGIHTWHIITFLLSWRNGFQESTRLSLLMPLANFQYKETKRNNTPSLLHCGGADGVCDGAGDKGISWWLSVEDAT